MGLSVKVYKLGNKRPSNTFKQKLLLKNVQCTYPKQDEMGEAGFIQRIPFATKHIY